MFRFTQEPLSENLKENLRTSSQGTRLESWLFKRWLPQWFPYTVYVDLFHLPNLMHNSLFIKNIYVTLQSSTCFEHQHAHLQEDKMYYHSIWYRHSLYNTVQYKTCRTRKITPTYANINMKGTNSRYQRIKDASLLSSGILFIFYSLSLGVTTHSGFVFAAL